MDRSELIERGFVRACATSEVPAVMPRRVALGARFALICRGREEGTYFALDELCPHKWLSMAFGIVHDGAIVCPHHQYTFDLATGRPRGARCGPVTTYEVAIAEDDVWIKVP